MTTATLTGVSVPCIRCCKADSLTLTLHTADFHCDECGDDFTADDVQEWLDSVAKWGRVLAWISAMPSGE